MRFRNALMLTVAGLVVGACDTRDDTADTEPGEDFAPVAPAEQPRDMMISTTQFQATGDAGAAQTAGMAELRHRGATWDDGLELRVNLTGLGEGDHAWHIHRGTCASPGDIAVPISGLPGRDGIGNDLDADSDGRAEATVTIDREHLAALQQGESYIVNVHQRGGDNPGPAIACAPLELTNAHWDMRGTGTMAPGTTGTPPATTTGY